MARVVTLYEMDVYTEKGGDYVATIQGAQQAVRLMPGNVFFLGSQEQSFVLTERR